MKTLDTTRHSQLRELFGRVFDEKWSRDELENYDELRDKFQFHMTDAMSDVMELAELYQTGEPAGTVEAGQLVYGFFLHAVPHLMAAAQIYDYIPRTFDEQKGVHQTE